MKISFIIAYHNEPQNMLRECLGTIVSLPIADKEVIVIDDGSDVSPTDLVMSVDASIRLVRQDNQGLSAARNHGVSCATGDYIQFVDADDKLLPEYSDVINALVLYNPDILQFRFTRKSTVVPKSLHIIFDGTGRQRLCNHNLRAAACAYVFRREILRDVRFVKGIYHEDELFTPLLFLNAERIIDTDAKAYFYRRRENSITTATDSAKIEKRLNDTLYVIEMLSELGNIALNRRISQLTMDYIYTILIQTHSYRILKERITRLRQLNLIPLPLKPYTVKYFLFALFTRIL